MNGPALAPGQNEQIEIVVLGPDDGALGFASPDADGNFWFQGTPFPDQSRVAIRRKGSGSRAMATPLRPEYASCNSAACHGSANLRIHAP